MDHAAEALAARFELVERVGSGSFGEVWRGLGVVTEFEEFVHLAHVEALDAVGRRDEADAVLYQARERMMRKGGRLREPALRAGFLEGVEWNRRLAALARLRLGSKG